jgi:hypothetical protein
MTSKGQISPKALMVLISLCGGSIQEAIKILSEEQENKYWKGVKDAVLELNRIEGETNDRTN